MDFDGGMVFYVVAGAEAPDQVPSLRVPGNRFELLGYYYYRSYDGERRLAARFDLLAWRPLPPYSVWSQSGEKIRVSDDSQVSALWPPGSTDSTTQADFAVAGRYDC